jgi:hypothetical protein
LSGIWKDLSKINYIQEKPTPQPKPSKHKAPQKLLKNKDTYINIICFDIETYHEPGYFPLNEPIVTIGVRVIDRDGK